MTAQLTLPPKPSSVSAARRFVVDVLLDLDAEGAVDDAATLVSELATNAVLHARTPFTVEVALDEGVLRIGVLDHSPAVPRMRDYGAEATTGRGMRLIESISSRWGVRTADDGKLVWFELSKQGVMEAGTPEEQSEDVLLALFGEPDEDGEEPAEPRVLGWVA
jgi:anti-sigma regulatory factor (Ser/Thr protein kinase)